MKKRSYSKITKPNFRYPKKYKQTVMNKISKFEELKYVDTSVALATIVGTIASAEKDPGTVNCLNAIAVGDGESDRDGKKYILKQVIVTGGIARGGASDLADVPAQMSCILALVLDKQTNNNQLNSEDVYTGSLPEYPLRNLKYSKRFKVLASQRFDFDSPTVGTDGTNTNSAGGQVKSFYFNKKLNIPVTCSGTSANCTDIVDNSLHIIAISSANSAPNQLQLEYSARVRFIG